MPKIKTRGAASKRFGLTKNGKVKRNTANRRHILTKKTTKYKRGLRKSAYVADSMAPVVKKLIPYK